MEKQQWRDVSNGLVWTDGAVTKACGKLRSWYGFGPSRPDGHTTMEWWTDFDATVDEAHAILRMEQNYVHTKYTREQVHAFMQSEAPSWLADVQSQCPPGVTVEVKGEAVFRFVRNGCPGRDWSGPVAAQCGYVRDLIDYDKDVLGYRPDEDPYAVSAGSEGVRPGSAGELGWPYAARNELPPGWTMAINRWGEDYAEVVFRSPCGVVFDDDIRCGAVDDLWSVRGCVQFGCKDNGLPDPYAQPTIVSDGRATLPTPPVEPPQDECIECGVGMPSCGAYCIDCKPDFSSANEIGMPVMPRERVAAELVAEPPPAGPQVGDVVVWDVHASVRGVVTVVAQEEGLVVPTDANGIRPATGYLWARRKFEGKTVHTHVAVELCSVRRKAGEL